MAGIPFPPLDPVIFSFGPVNVAWYVPALLAVIVAAGTGFMWRRARTEKWSENVAEDLSVWGLIALGLSVAAIHLFRQPMHEMAVGPLAVRWYAVAYLIGFVLGWRYCISLARQNPKGPPPKLYDDFLIWAVVGTVLGGRIGYVLFYQPEYYFSDPAAIFQIWHGGMSFHGGMLGVIAASLIFVRRNNISFLAFTDILACVVPIGLGFGRLANFVNAELYGRATTLPWGMIFPCRANVPESECPGPLPRHPSQLYEAFLEGLVLFIIMYILARKPHLRDRPGFLSGAFLFFYGLFRFTSEFFREPDIQLGFLLGGSTMGQLLSLPMIMFGVYLVARSKPEASC